MKKEQQGNEQQQKQKQQILCSICFQQSAKAQIDCLHKFCPTCILKWSQTNSTCPLCRRKTKLIRYGNKVRVVKIRKNNKGVFANVIRRRRVIVMWKPMLFMPIPYFCYFMPMITQPSFFHFDQL